MDTWYGTKAYFTITEVKEHFDIDNTKLTHLVHFHNMETHTWPGAPIEHLSQNDVRIIGSHLQRPDTPAHD